MEPLKFDPTKNTVGASFEVSEERNVEMSRLFELAWHELTTPNEEFKKEGIDMANGLYKFGSLAQTPEELLLAGYSFGRAMEKYKGQTNPLVSLFSMLKGK